VIGIRVKIEIGIDIMTVTEVKKGIMIDTILWKEPEVLMIVIEKDIPMESMETPKRMTQIERIIEEVVQITHLKAMPITPPITIVLTALLVIVPTLLIVIILPKKIIPIQNI